jgi:hypothetical protein
MDVSRQPHTPVALPSEINPGSNRTGDFVDSRTALGSLKKDKFLSLQVFKYRRMW